MYPAKHWAVHKFLPRSLMLPSHLREQLGSLRALWLATSELGILAAFFLWVHHPF